MRELLLLEKFPSPLALPRRESESERRNFNPPPASNREYAELRFKPRSCAQLSAKSAPRVEFRLHPSQKGNNNTDQSGQLEFAKHFLLLYMEAFI